MAIQNDGIPVGALPVNSSNNGIPAITFTPGLADKTPEQKAAEYNSLIGRGFNDAQIRSAADTTFGVQSASDWDYLTNLARQAPATQIANTTGVVNQGLPATAADVATQGIGSLPQATNPNVLGGVILAGDSWLSNPSTEASFESQLGQNVTNVAFGGARSGDALNQLNSFIDAGGTFSPGSTVMLNLGGNDLLEGRDPASVRNNLNQIVSTLGNLGVKVILSGASNVGSVADVTGSTNLAMSSIYNDVASSNPNVKLVDSMSGLLNQKNLVTEDGFHLNDAGRTAFNATLSNAFLQGQGLAPIEFSDQAIRDFAAVAGLTPEQAAALAPSFGLTKDRVLDALSPDVTEQITQQFKVTDGTAPTTEGILSGFKYANDSGISEDRLKRTLGEDLFNTYKTGFADYAKTGIANILADNQLSFDEARQQVKFGRDYGYDAQKLADLTGTKKEVFDAIYKNYDDTTNKVVDGVLGAEGVKTDADRISNILKLQKQFGFTDEDVAKAADYDVKKLKADLAPIRSFDSDYEKLVKDPDLNEDKTRTFLTTALQNPYIKQKLGDKLQPALDELNRPPRERILDQVGKQREVLGGNYYRGVFGNPEVIADVLERKGVKSLADLGKRDKFEATPAEKRYFAPDGSRVDDLGDGTFGVVGAEGGYSSVVPKSQVRTEYGYTEQELREGPEGGYYESKFVPLASKDVDKDGNYQKNVGTVVVNKRTGEELTGTDHQLAAQSSSGGLRKKFNTLKVGFDKNGNAVLTAASERAGLGGLVQDLAPMISMALPFVLPGLGSALSGMLPGAGVAASGATAAIAPTLMNQALTQGIISGGLTTLGGGQFEKGFLSGAINPVVNTGISSLLPAGINPDLAKSLTGAGTAAVRGAFQGGDFSDILKGGITQGLADYGVNTALGASGLTPQQLNFVTGIAAPLLQGNKINPVTAFGTLVNADQQRQRARP